MAHNQSMGGGGVTKQHGATATTQNTKKTLVAPSFKKYATTGQQSWIDPSSKLKPSDLDKPAVNVVSDDYPMIIEFNNLKDNSLQVHSQVDIDQPLFQPSPKVIVFEEYAPFAVHEKKLFFRNSDSVRNPPPAKDMHTPLRSFLPCRLYFFVLFSHICPLEQLSLHTFDFPSN